MRAHEEALLQPVLDHITGCNGARLLGPDQASLRAPTVALALTRPGAEAAAQLAERGIMAGGGDFYAVRPLRAMGIDPDRGVLRLSFVHYTSKEEIDKLLNALGDIL